MRKCLVLLDRWLMFSSAFSFYVELIVNIFLPQVPEIKLKYWNTQKSIYAYISFLFFLCFFFLRVFSSDTVFSWPVPHFPHTLLSACCDALSLWRASHFLYHVPLCFLSFCCFNNVWGFFSVTWDTSPSLEWHKLYFALYYLEFWVPRFSSFSKNMIRGPQHKNSLSWQTDTFRDRSKIYF